MDRLLAQVRRTIRRFALMPPGTRVVAAVSGGADSVALAHVLMALEAEGICRLAALAHLNHGLRGAAADEDEACCRRLAAELDRPLLNERADVAALARERGVSIEAAGHLARYAFFERAAARVSADRVALGHTRDDQAETFLLRLMRGAGPDGLAGMRPANGLVVRPLLDCSRGDVRRFVLDRRLPFREDETNADLSVARNRVRHELLPALAAIQPAIVAVLSREAAIAGEDAEALSAAAAAALGRVTRNGHDGLVIDVGGLMAQPPAVARRIVRLALGRWSGGRFVGFDHVEGVLELARRATEEPRATHLPGQIASREAGTIVLRPNPVIQGEGSSGVGPTTGFSLSIPGEVMSPSGWAISAARATPDGLIVAGAKPVFPRSWAVLDAGLVPPVCSVRTWRPGDRMRLLGSSGTRKLQDLFVDRKVPREARSRVPLVAVPDGRVMWVAGWATSGDFAVTEATRDVVILKLRYWRNGT